MVQQTFNYTEEAFLYDSLNEVVKVWARGFGQSNFSIEVRDGTAEVKISFSLGHPTDPHILPMQQSEEQSQQLPPATTTSNEKVKIKRKYK